MSFNYILIKKAMENEECVGAIVCKLDRYKDLMRGYIAMLDVKAECRRKQIGELFVFEMSTCFMDRVSCFTENTFYALVAFLTLF